MRLKTLLKPALVLLALGPAEICFAHGGEAGLRQPHNWHELASAWEFDPGVVISLLVSAWLYVQGVARIWKVTHVGCGIKRSEVASFVCGWLTLVIALISPLHPWGRALFSAHMTQHELLMLVAAPLLVLGWPLVAFLKALPPPLTRKLVSASHHHSWQGVWRILTHPFVAWLLHALILWAWHAPALFEATLRSDFVHSLQHISFLGSALLFWWALLQGRARAMGYGIAVLYLFTTAMHSGLLGALLTLATSVWYPTYAAASSAWELTPLEDQQIGGLIMWVPAALVYVFAAVALFAGWLRESERRVRARETEPVGSKRLPAGAMLQSAPKPGCSAAFGATTTPHGD